MEEPISVKQISMKDEIISGLNRPQKRIPSKYFYDERGSRLFEQITGLEEYYLTRSEKEILTRNIGEISECIGQDAVLIEPGSGSSRKTRLLLDNLPSLVAYIPVDISEEYLREIAAQLREDYPGLLIRPVCADYSSGFELPGIDEAYRRQVVFFPGSTIGNFQPEHAASFLENVASLTGRDSAMLIGVDLKKEKGVLEAAYNDSQGVTARFNRNMLVRINRELNAGFTPDRFGHRAFYDEEEGRIEMHLVSEGEQEVSVAGETVYFEEGETIHTENSYKYSPDEFAELVGDWFSVGKVWTDDREYFSLQFLRKK